MFRIRGLSHKVRTLDLFFEGKARTIFDTEDLFASLNMILLEIEFFCLSYKVEHY